MLTGYEIENFERIEVSIDELARCSKAQQPRYKLTIRLIFDYDFRLKRLFKWLTLKDLKKNSNPKNCSIVHTVARFG